MKGLLYKDLMILKQQARTLLIIGLCGVFMSFEFEGEFVIGYMSVIAAFSVLGTIGYDEFDHGYSFLFTLPVHRKTYVREKYLLTLLAVLCTSLAGFLIALGVRGLILHKPIAGTDMLEGSLITMGVALLMSAVSIPLRIKYGSEKSRLVQYLIYAVVLAAVLGASSLAKLLHIDLSAFSAPDANLAVPIILMLFVFLFVLSEKICEGIISRKEF